MSKFASGGTASSQTKAANAKSNPVTLAVVTCVYIYTPLRTIIKIRFSIFSWVLYKQKYEIIPKETIVYIRKPVLVGRCVGPKTAGLQVSRGAYGSFRK